MATEFPGSVQCSMRDITSIKSNIRNTRAIGGAVFHWLLVAHPTVVSVIRTDF